MTIRYEMAIEDQVMAYARTLQDWLRRRYSDPDAFRARLREGLSFGVTPTHLEEKVDLASGSLGLFSQELLQALLSGGEPYKPMLVAIVWNRMLEAGLLVKSLPVGTGIPLADHQLLQKPLLQHLSNDTFLNLFALPSRFPTTYAGAVAAVDVSKGGDLARGTGFVVRHGGRQFFVTCKHNVDPEDGVVLKSITSAADEPLEIGDFALSASFDIAIALMKRDIAGPCFALSEDVEVFDEVFTLGFPLVPRAEPLLVGHRGELNGRAHLYMEQCPALIISNLVSPGSSGGPVLTRDGRCVGMTINWLEGELQSTEALRFSAALPATLLLEEVTEIADRLAGTSVAAP